MSYQTIYLVGNNGFTVQDHPEPEEWIRPIRKAQLKHLEFFADHLDPIFYANVIKKKSEYLQTILKWLEDEGVSVASVTTGRLSYLTNGLSHPYADMRAEGLRWCEGLAKLAKALGTKHIGGHFDYITLKDLERRPAEAVTRQLEGLLKLAAVCAKQGIESIFLEQMYTPSLKPYTINEADRIIEYLNERAAVRFDILVDTGHAALVPRGDRNHSNRDKDPYIWMSHKYPGVKKLWVHCQQTDREHTRHWPFTSRYNRLGYIAPDSIVQAALMSGCETIYLAFEVLYARGTPITQINGDMKVTGERFRRALHKAGYREHEGAWIPKEEVPPKA